MSTEYEHLPSWLVVGSTGHRSVSNPSGIAEALQGAINRIGLIHPRVAGVSSAAKGSDTLFAEEMAKRGCPFTLILPFPWQRFEQDFDNKNDWTRVRALAERDDVEVIYQATSERQAMRDSASQFPAPAGAKTQEQQRTDNDAYMDAGYRTVDQSDVVIAVWDGQPARGWGGTAYAVKYAQDTLKPLVIIHPETGAVIEERMELLKHQFAHHGSGEPATPLSGREIDPRAEVDAFYKAANAAAEQHGPASRLLVRVSLLLFLAASAIGYAAMIFETRAWMDYLFSGGSFACIRAGTIVMIVHARRHGQWLRRRVDAEVCRSFLATWEIRQHATFNHQPRPAVPGMRRIFVNLRMLRKLDAKRAERAISLEEGRSRYDESRVEDQIRYFARHQRIASVSLRRGRLAMKVFNITALIFSLTVLALSVWGGSHSVVREILHFFAVTLPLAVTAMGITLMTQESARRAARYKEMLEALRPLQRRLRAANTWDSLAMIATEVEEELLQELVEWRSFIRFTRDVARP